MASSACSTPLPWIQHPTCSVNCAWFQWRCGTVAVPSPARRFRPSDAPLSTLESTWPGSEAPTFEKPHVVLISQVGFQASSQQLVSSSHRSNLFCVPIECVSAGSGDEPVQRPVIACSKFSARRTDA